MFSKVALASILSYSQASEAWSHAKQDEWAIDFPTCGTGKEQSPINLFSTATVIPRLAITLDSTYKNYFGDRVILKEPYTIKEGFTDGGMSLTFYDGSMSSFVPAQFHIHAPSEHTFDGVSRDLELHFVHLYAGGGLGAVIGVTFDRVAGGNKDSYFLDQIIPVYNTSASVTELKAQTTYIKTFLESLDLSQFWSYPGSLTTPPCTEGIKWSVLKEAQPISDRQLKLFQDAYANNPVRKVGTNRLIQPLNERTLYQSGDGPSKWIQATIILGVLLGVMIICLIVIVIISQVCQNKLNKKMNILGENAPATNREEQTDRIKLEGDK